MDYGNSLERYRRDTSVRNLLTNSRFVGVALLFLTVVGAAVGTSLAFGYDEGAAIVLSWSALILAVVFFFGVLPVFASRFLPVYEDF
jgi:hypothetical protein